MGPATPKIAACLIVRDAADTLERCLASVRPFVYEVAVYDTGSRDGTLELLERLRTTPGAPVAVERGEWRDDFAWAREQSFALASAEADWLLWLDADDELEGGDELGRLAAGAPADVDGFLVFYDYDRDESGRPIVQLWRERLVRRAAGYRWQGAVHETLVPPARRLARLVRAPRERLRVVHRGAREGGVAERNLRILRAQAEPDTRTLLHLGTEEAFFGFFEAASIALREYLARTGPDWPDERVQAAARLSACVRALERPEEAIQVAAEAARARPDWTETALALAEAHAVLEAWPEVERWAARAAELGVPDSEAVLAPRRLTVLPRLLAARARLAVGRAGEAVAAFAEAVEVAAGDEAVRLRYEQFRDAVAAGDEAGADAAVEEAAGRFDETLHAVVRGLSAGGT